MKKTLKRLGAAFLAGALVAAMAVPAMAAPETLTDGKAGELYTSTEEGKAIGNEIEILKQIVIFNTTDGTSVYNPDLVYEYTITPDTEVSATVKDGDNDSATVKAGVAAAIDTKTDVTFTSEDQTAAKKKGTIAEKKFSITFKPNEFPTAGIYRYKIEEGLKTGAGYENNTYAARGVTHVGTDTVRYLDVYVRKDPDDSTKKVIYGYVLSSADDSKNEHNGSINPDPDAGLTTKTNGFLPVYDSATGVVTSGDYYLTYNLKVTKKLDGDFADKNEDFPFYVAMSGTGLEGPKVTVSGQLTSTPKFTSGALNLGDTTIDSALKMKGNEFVEITGIPAAVTSEVTEWNSSYDIYKVWDTKTAIKEGTATFADDGKSVNPRTRAGSITEVKSNVVTETNASLTGGYVTNDLELTVTNEIAIVSPTGVALRFAPYLMMLVAGLAIFFVGHKRREED